jgi:hypothetical protein
MEFGQRIKSKATGAVGELLGIKGSKLIVTFGNTDGIEVSPEYIDIDRDLMEEIEKEMSLLKAKKKTKKKISE